MKNVLEMMAKVARSDASTVLVQGESGTGKELVAKYIHYESARAEKPFVAINCAAVPATLLESELFGHEKGAFTDAKGRKKGVFELADGGTLFLDEIGDMASGLQSKLLRVLETGCFRRVGGTHDIYVTVRVVAATNRDLKREVQEGRFRNDLYYRLAVVPIHIPPLRERPVDIPLLAAFFLEHLNREMNVAIEGFTDEAASALLRYSWPGNVRELRNVVERGMLLGSGSRIEARHLPQEVFDPAGTPGNPPPPETGVWAMADAERFAIERALRHFKGNKTRAADALGVSRQTLRSKMREYGLAGSDDEA